MKRPIHYMGQAMGCKTAWYYIRHSCLISTTHETSNAIRGATFRMQNTMELRHSCLIVATHETSSTMSGATGATLQHHHMLRLPRKARRHEKSPSNITKCCACHEKSAVQCVWHRSYKASYYNCGRLIHDSNVIRP